MVGRAKMLDRFIDRLAEKNKLTVVIEIDVDSVDSDFRPKQFGHIVRAQTAHLIQTIEEVCQQFRPNLMIIVTSPSQRKTESVTRSLQLISSVKIDSVTMVLNCLTIEDQIAQNEDLRDQIKEADVLMPIKTDLLDSIRIQHLIGILRSLNPNAPILSMESEDSNPAQLYGLNLIQKAMSKGSLPFRCREKTNGDFDRLSCFRIDFHKAVDGQQLLDQLNELRPELYRVEGIVEVNNGRMPQHFKYIRGRVEFSEYPDPTVLDRFIILVSKKKDTYYEAFID